MNQQMRNTTILNFIRDINHLSTGKPWYGKGYEQILKDVDEDLAFHDHEIFSIAELLGHVISWRSYVLHVIEHNKGNLNDDHPNNWRDLDTLKHIGWTVLQLQFYQIGDQITDLLRSKNDSWLENAFTTYYQETITFHYLLQGMMQHDVYHLGQIAFLKKCIRGNF